jgi:hypothetical protein
VADSGVGRKPPSAPIDQLLTGSAENADVIVDFSAQAGAEFYLINEGPDEAFGGGVPETFCFFRSGRHEIPASCDESTASGRSTRGRLKP